MAEPHPGTGPVRPVRTGGLRRAWRRRRCRFLLGTALAVAAFLSAAGVAAWRWREVLNPDGVCYIRLAGYLAGGDLRSAASGYWSPLISWSMAPLVACGVDGLLAARIVLVAWGGALLLAAGRLLRRSTTLPPGWAALALATIAAAAVRWSVEEITPDVVVGACLLLYLSASADRGLFRSRWRPFGCGLLGGLAYLAKAYALPFVLIHFLATVALRAMLRRREASLRRAAAAWAAGMLGLSLAAGPWIGALSWKYGRFTWSTAAGINHAIVNPDGAMRPSAEPCPEPRPPHIALWETPEVLPYNRWSPFRNRQSARRQLEIVGRNLPHIARIVSGFDAWSLGALALALGPLAAIALRRRRRWRFRGLWFAFTAAVYCSGYALIFANRRFLEPVLLPLACLWSFQLGALLVGRLQDRIGRPRPPWSGLPGLAAAAALAGSFVAVHARDTWRRYFRLKPPPSAWRTVADAARSAGCAGPVSSNRWAPGLFVAHHLNTVFLDRPPAAPKVRTVLYWRHSAGPAWPPAGPGWKLRTTLTAPHGEADCTVDIYEMTGAPPRRPPPAVPDPVPGRRMTSAELIVAAARREVERGTPYQPGYHRIAYPGGDVPDGGACTDLVVRALRGAGLDLQKLVHEDMRADFDAYPKLWGLSRPDPNIDHRRVPNLMTFFRRRGPWLPTGTSGAEAAGWRPGDVVFWDLGAGGQKHCGIVSDRRAPSGLPLVIHNIAGAAEEDVLTRWKVIGHARPPAGAGPGDAAR